MKRSVSVSSSVVVVVLACLAYSVFRDVPAWKLKAAWKAQDYATCMQLLEKMPKDSRLYTKTYDTRWLVVEQLALASAEEQNQAEQALELFAQIPADAPNKERVREYEMQLNRAHTDALAAKAEAVRREKIQTDLHQTMTRISSEVIALSQEWIKPSAGTLLTLTEKTPFIAGYTLGNNGKPSGQAETLDIGDMINIELIPEAGTGSLWYKVIANGTRKGWIHADSLHRQLAPSHIAAVKQRVAAETKKRQEQFLKTYSEDTGLTLEQLRKYHE
jgi:hypothetical protein